MNLSFNKIMYILINDHTRTDINGRYELLAMSNALCPVVESVLPGASDDEMLGGISSSPNPDCSNCNASNLSSSSWNIIHSIVMPVECIDKLEF